MANKISESQVSCTLAKQPSGDIQINFTIDKDLVSKTKKEILEEMAKTAEIPGFRKGNAPIDKVEASIDKADISQKILEKILPKAMGDAIDEYKIRPVVYPRFEVVSIKDGENWQIRATTCEFVEFDLGDYKNIVSGALKSKKIWTPDQGKDQDKKQPTREEKEQVVIKTLLDNIKPIIPNKLIEEEVNLRLSSLLEKLEKLGLNLDGYLHSIGKTTQQLRDEYSSQAKDTIALELILERVTKDQNIKVEEAEIDQVIKASSADVELSKKLDTPQQRQMIRNMLTKRKTLEYLTNLS